jgi:hypothetical protein
MNSSIILDIDSISYANFIDITSDYSIEPNTAFIAHYYIAHNGSIRGYKAIFTKHGKNAIYRINKTTHIFCLKGILNIIKNQQCYFNKNNILSIFVA